MLTLGLKKMKKHDHLGKTKQMFRILVIAARIKISFFISSDDHRKFFAVEMHGCIYRYIFCGFKNRLLCSEIFFSLFHNFVRGKELDGSPLNGFHFSNRMLLVVNNISGM